LSMADRCVFSRMSLFFGGRGFGHAATSLLVGETSEVVLDLDFKSHETGGISVQSFEPLLFDCLDLLAQLGGEIRQAGKDGWVWDWWRISMIV
jgi:hypothetical protein